jgi:hypothetical protein
MKIKITNIDRIICAVVSIPAFILFLFYLFLQLNFLGSLNFLNLNTYTYNSLPRIDKNDNFDTGYNIVTKLFLNTLMLFAFFTHHLIFANKRVKDYLSTLKVNYPTYERGLFILFADIFLIFTFLFWQPINIPIIIIENVILIKLFTFIQLCSIVEFLFTLKFIYKCDLTGVKRLFTVLTSDELEFPLNFNLEVPMINWTCRHPMYGSLLMFTFSSSTVITIGHLLYYSAILTGTLVGVGIEERQLNQYEDYIKYKTIVKNRFIPNLCNLLKLKQFVEINNCNNNQ